MSQVGARCSGQQDSMATQVCVVHSSFTRHQRVAYLSMTMQPQQRTAECVSACAVVPTCDVDSLSHIVAAAVLLARATRLLTPVLVTAVVVVTVVLVVVADAGLVVAEVTGLTLVAGEDVVLPSTWRTPVLSLAWVEVPTPSAIGTDRLQQLCFSQQLLLFSATASSGINSQH